MELSQILSDESGKFDVNIRVAAGLAAKNCLVARDTFRRQQLIETFRGIDPSIKSRIKGLVNLHTRIRKLIFILMLIYCIFI